MALDYCNFLCLSLYISASVSQIETIEPSFLFIIARHGERRPCHSFPSLEFPREFLEKKCELTEGGARQHIAFGEFVRHRYPSLISEDYDEKELLIRSTATRRTLLSANYFANGLYPRKENRLQVIPPIFSVPKMYDHLLKISCPCPMFKNLSKIALTSDLAKQFSKEESNLFNELEKLTNLTFDPAHLYLQLPQVWALCDAIYVWHHLRASETPRWITKTLIDSCSRALGFKQHIHFSTPELTRLRGGPLVVHLMDLLKMKTSQLSSRFNQSSDFDLMSTPTLANMITHKVDALDIPISREANIIAYFAHDSTIAAFLSHLGIFNNLLPPFASAVLVELFKTSSNKYRVRFLYRNITDSKKAELVHLLPTCCHSTASSISGCQLDILLACMQNTAALNLNHACRYQPSNVNFDIYVLDRIDILHILFSFIPLFFLRIDKALVACHFPFLFYLLHPTYSIIV